MVSAAELIQQRNSSFLNQRLVQQSDERRRSEDEAQRQQLIQDQIKQQEEQIQAQSDTQDKLAYAKIIAQRIVDKEPFATYGVPKDIRKVALAIAYPSIDARKAADEARAQTEEKASVATQTPVPLQPVQSSVLQASEEINPNTGRPYGTLTKAPTIYQQYDKVIENKNPVTGTIKFAADYLRSLFAKSEEQAGGAARLAGGETGERVQSAAEAGLFLSPAGVVLAPAAGLGTFTPGGRKEVSSTAEALQTNYGISPVVTKGTLYGLGGLTAALGIYSGYNYLKGLALQSEALNPQVKFVGISKGDETKIVSKANVGGQEISSIGKYTNVKNEEGSVIGTRGQEIVKSTPSAGITQLTRREVASLNQEPAATPSLIQSVKDNPLIQSVVTTGKDLKSFFSRGISTNREYVQYPSQLPLLDTIDENPVSVISKSITQRGAFPTNLQKTNIAGVTKVLQDQAENIVSVAAGPAKMRIFKAGGIQYVFSPSIRGFIKIVGDDTSSASKISPTVITDLAKNVPLGSIQKGIEEAAQAQIAPTVADLATKAATATGISKVVAAAESILQPKVTSPSVSVKVVPEQKLKAINVIAPPIEKEKEGEKTVPKLKPASIPKGRSGTVPLTVPAQQPAQSTIQTPITIPVEIPATEQLQSPVVTPVPQVTPNTTRTFIPPVPPIKLSSPIPSKVKSFDMIKLGKAYNVFVRRKGKEVKVASSLPFGKATKAGVSRNLTDLSASFRLEEAGTTAEPDISFKAPSIFKPSKRNPSRLVQSSKTRLSARSEVLEIQGAKRSKSRRLKLF